MRVRDLFFHLSSYIIMFVTSSQSTSAFADILSRLIISSVSDLDYQQPSSSYLPSLVSVIWIMNFVGFMIAGLTNVLITDRFGFGIAAPFGSSMQAVAYALICWGCPYPLFLIAYIFNGFGLGLQVSAYHML